MEWPLPSSFHWPLPDRPDHPVYPDLLADIAATEDTRERRCRLRAVCEADFWFFCRFAASFGDYVISDSSHRRFGQLWADEPWVFDRCRDLQQATVQRESGVFWNWPRYHFKTQLATCLHTCWIELADTTQTTAILTYKVDETGESMFGGIRDELEKNPKIAVLWPDAVSPAVIKYWTKTSLTLERELGAREPSIALYSLDHLPTSMHFHWIKVDDAVVKETVRSQLMIMATRDWMRKVTPIGRDDSLTWWIGTLWDKEDPYMMCVNDGTFKRRDHWSPYGRGAHWRGRPVLRSERMLNEWRRTMQDYDFSCQMVGEPVARGDQALQETWLTESRYQNTPQQEKIGKKIHMVVDGAGGGKGGDWTVIYIQGLGEDRRRYSLELYRERLSIIEPKGLELLFKLVKIWRPETVWVEEFGDGGHTQAIKNEMEHRGFRFRVRKLPGIKRSKIERIRLYQPVQARNEIMWPAAGFGHGGKKDRRDTFDQFRSDEYRLWVPIEGATLHDDMLDAVAWTIQPEVLRLMRFPVSELEEEGVEHAAPGGFSGGIGNVSPWVL